MFFPVLALPDSAVLWVSRSQPEPVSVLLLLLLFLPAVSCKLHRFLLSASWQQLPAPGYVLCNHLQISQDLLFPSSAYLLLLLRKPVHRSVLWSQLLWLRFQILWHPRCPEVFSDHPVPFSIRSAVLSLLHLLSSALHPSVSARFLYSEVSLKLPDNLLHPELSVPVRLPAVLLPVHWPLPALLSCLHIQPLHSQVLPAVLCKILRYNLLLLMLLQCQVSVSVHSCLPHSDLVHESVLHLPSRHYHVHYFQLYPWTEPDFSGCRKYQCWYVLHRYSCLISQSDKSLFPGYFHPHLLHHHRSRNKHHHRSVSLLSWNSQCRHMPGNKVFRFLLTVLCKKIHHTQLLHLHLHQDLC